MSRRRKYAWEDWFAQGGFVLVRGIHYQCPQSTIVQAIRNNASMRGLRIRLQDTGLTVVVTVVGRKGEADDTVSHTDKAPVIIQ
jgi:hypothetical protein